jgi:polyhydroxybutyrate depolymerase
MRRWAAALMLATAAAAPARACTIRDGTLNRPEGTRRFTAVIPDAPAKGRRPLVLLLHGHVGSARQVLGLGRGAAPLSRWKDLADRDGVLVIAADGERGADHKQGWNDCRADARNNPKTDDVGFLRALLDHAVETLDADPARVYVMGMSNGAMMAYRVAVELGPRVAAFAAVSGSMAVKNACPEAKTPVSALIINGTRDPLVPYAGGEVGFRRRRDRGLVMPVAEVADFWRELDGLPAKPAASGALPHLSRRDKTRAVRTVWGKDPKGLQVELVRVEGGGHVEPSPTRRIGRLYGLLVGPQNGDFEAADEAWAFFRDKRTPAR